MNSTLTLLPYPRNLIINNGYHKLQAHKYIQIRTPNPSQVLFASRQIADCINEHFDLSWELTASRSIPPDCIGLQIKINPAQVKNTQGYYLKIAEDKIDLIGSDHAGVFYGVQTLKQIISQSSRRNLPNIEIEDWPDYLVRGVMLDISRDKVYRMETLFMLIDELAAWKINQLQLYTEHTFAYLGHDVVWQNSSPMTAEDILTLDKYCSERQIDLVPNQNTFGHMTRWLKHPQYQHLAERIKPARTPWGHVMTEPFSLAPTLPDTRKFISGLFDQLLPNFSTKMINVDCDETFDLGMGKSKEICERKGKGQVYLDYILALYQDLSLRRHHMQLWADIMLQHPDLIAQLPKDIILLDWAYEADHSFKVETRKFKEAGLPYYVCPGTSSWNSIAGRIANMLENCKNAAQSGLANSADGFLITDWGDNGHWQQLPISYPGFVAGAAFSWCLASNLDFDLPGTLNTVVFKDHSGIIGQMMVDIGNEYKSWGITLPNSSPLFWLLQESKETVEELDIEDQSLIQASMDRLEKYRLALETINLDRSDALDISDELALTINLLTHACKRALFIFNFDSQIKQKNLLREITGLIEDFSVRWLRRNRPGGLNDSIARFNTLLDEYQSA